MCDPITAAVVIGSLATVYAATNQPKIPDVGKPKTDDSGKAAASAKKASELKAKQAAGQFDTSDTKVTGGTGAGALGDQYLGKKNVLGGI